MTASEQEKYLRKQSKMTQRLDWLQYYIFSKKGLLECARHFGVTKNSFYSGIKYYIKHNPYYKKAWEEKAGKLRNKGSINGVEAIKRNARLRNHKMNEKL